jgi:Double zinc ribbon
MLLATLGIDIDLIIQLLILFLVVTYLALIYWTYLDAKRRIDDPVLIACATAASLFPFLGTVVYTIVRPPEFREDREERELELRAAEIQLRQLIEQSCPHCEYPIERGYLRCPNCERRLRSPCRKCSKPLDPKWGVCPYCEAEVRKPRDQRERQGGRREERSGRGDRGARTARAPTSQRSSGRTDRPGTRSERPASRSERQGSGNDRPGSRSDRSDSKSDGGSRRESGRPAVRAQGGRSERPTGGASGSFPSTDRER